MNLDWLCGVHRIYLLLLVFEIYMQQTAAFQSPSFSFSSTNHIRRFGKAVSLSNHIKVLNSLVDDVGIFNQPTIQRSIIPSADEAIGIGLPTASPSNLQVTKSSRSKGIDWTYEMDVELFSLHWRYKQKHHVIEDVDWVEIAEELNEPGIYGNECLERYDFLHTDEYEKFVMHQDDNYDET